MGTRGRLWAVVTVWSLGLTGCVAPDVGTAPPADMAPAVDPTADLADGEVALRHPPAATGGDPLAGLPQTRATARMLVSTSSSEDGARALILDLAAGAVVVLDEVAEFPYDDVALTAAGAVFAVDARTLGFVDTDGKPDRATVTLPDDVPGVLRGLEVHDDTIMVSTFIPDDPDQPLGRGQSGPLVLYDLDGTVRCTSDRADRYAYFSEGERWSLDLRSRLDLGTCAVRAGLQSDEPVVSSFFVTSGMDAYTNITSQSVSRLDLADAQVSGTSPDLGGLVMDVAVQEGLWALAGDRLVLLDPDTLAVRATVYEFGCGDLTRFVTGLDDLYVVNECVGALYRIDTGSKAVVDGWYLPTDGSDNETTAYVQPDGLWIVDVEQTGVPYFFNEAASRFERLPLGRAITEPIYALTFQVAD